MKTYRPFFFIVGLVLVVGLACGALSPSEPTAVPLPPTQPVVVPTVAVPTQVVQQEQPTQQVQQQPTTPPVTSGPFFTEEFDSDPQWYYEVIQDNDSSDPDNIKISFEDSLMVFEIPDPFLYAYYIYDGYDYEDVRVDIRLENRGVNTQQVSLICRQSDDGWYEWAVQSDGLWVMYAVSGGFNRVLNGGSNDINQGKDVNEYSMVCKGDEISFFINGEEQRGSPFIDRDYGFREGGVGFSISALRAVPVKIEVDWFKISEP